MKNSLIINLILKATIIITILAIIYKSIKAKDQNDENGYLTLCECFFFYQLLHY